jgi:hypothetical protein
MFYKVCYLSSNKVCVSQLSLSDLLSAVFSSADGPLLDWTSTPVTQLLCPQIGLHNERPRSVYNHSSGLTPMCLCVSFPQSAEGARDRGSQCRAPGFGDPHSVYACAHGGREHNADALDEEDHSGGRPLSAAAVPHPAARRPALQSTYYFAGPHHFLLYFFFLGLELEYFLLFFYLFLELLIHYTCFLIDNTVLIILVCIVVL